MSPECRNAACGYGECARSRRKHSLCDYLSSVMPSFGSVDTNCASRPDISLTEQLRRVAGPGKKLVYQVTGACRAFRYRATGKAHSPSIPDR